MTGALARRWNLDWTARTEMPEGPVSLWIAVLGSDGTLLGAGPCRNTPQWEWYNGALTCNYGPVHMDILQPGRTCSGVIVAVSEQAREYAPVLPFKIDFPEPVMPGVTLTVVNGRIAISEPHRLHAE